MKDQSEKERWQVTADHPVWKRPDKTCHGKMAECDARIYAAELEGLGYENVKVTNASPVENKA